MSFEQRSFCSRNENNNKKITKKLFEKKKFSFFLALPSTPASDSLSDKRERCDEADGDQIPTTFLTNGPKHDMSSLFLIIIF